MFGGKCRLGDISAQEGDDGGDSLVHKRSWPEITVSILEVTATPVNKMRIMYRSNLNFQRFNRYFYDLLRKGFIEEIKGSDKRSSYKITERGRTLLAALRKVDELLFSEEN